jgi:hypothetical protein
LSSRCPIGVSLVSLLLLSLLLLMLLLTKLCSPGE